MTTATPAVGPLLRRWRERRRLSQLELAIQADVSTRHLSFVETGRSAPSRDMVLHLADRLEVPLRERNQLLLAAGYAPAYPESTMDSSPMASVRDAMRQVLSGHDPYPAVVVDRHWNLVDANASASLLTGLVAPHLLGPPANVLRASLHPDGLARHIANLGEWRTHLLDRLRRQVAATADPDLTGLLRELEGYPGERATTPGPGGVVIPLRLRVGDRDLAFLSTVTVFGTPLDVTVSELAIEAFYPADAATREALNAA